MKSTSTYTNLYKKGAKESLGRPEAVLLPPCLRIFSAALTSPHTPEPVHRKQQACILLNGKENKTNFRRNCHAKIPNYVQKHLGSEGEDSCSTGGKLLLVFSFGLQPTVDFCVSTKNLTFQKGMWNKLNGLHISSSMRFIAHQLLFFPDTRR